MNELIIPQKPAEIAVLFKPQGLDVLLRKIEDEATAFKPDTSTAKGRKEIASQAHKVARSKTLLDDAGKDLAADRKKEIAEIDAERRRAREFLDDLKERVRKPLTEWEAAEAFRVSQIKEYIETLRTCDDLALLKTLEIQEDMYNEFLTEALQAKDERLKILEAEEIIRKQKEQEEKEAAERAAKKKAEDEAKAEQERKEREERIAREAAEKARREEQEKAAKEKAEAEEKARLETERLKREKAEAEENERRIAKAKQDAIEEERKRKEAERLAAEEKQRKAEERERRKPEEQQLKNFWGKLAPIAQDFKDLEIKDVELSRKKDAVLQYFEGIRTILISVDAGSAKGAKG